MCCVYLNILLEFYVYCREDICFFLHEMKQAPIIPSLPGKRLARPGAILKDFAFVTMGGWRAQGWDPGNGEHRCSSGLQKFQSFSKDAYGILRVKHGPAH